MARSIQARSTAQRDNANRIGRHGNARGRPIATGARPGRAHRRRRRRERDDRARAQSTPRADRVSSSPIRATRAATFREAELEELAASIRSAASSSRSWCARCAARATRLRSSPASGAGGRRNARACMRFRSSRSKRPTARRSSSPSSRTCSVPISIRWKRRRGYQALASEYQHSQEDIAQDRRQEPQPRRQHVAPAEAARAGQGLYQCRQDLRRRRAHAGRARPTRKRWHARSSTADSTCVRSRRSRSSAEPPGKAVESGRATRTPTRLRSRSALSDALGLNVTIDHRDRSGGVLHIRYRGLDQLEEVLRRLEGRANPSGTDLRYQPPRNLTCHARLTAGARIRRAKGEMAGSSAHDGALLVSPCSHRYRQQRALRDELGDSGLPSRFQRGVGKLRHRLFEPLRSPAASADAIIGWRS